jgi:hypothetical protein
MKKVLVFAGSAFAAEQAAPAAPAEKVAAPAVPAAPADKPVMLKGKVEVMKEAGKVTGIAIMTAEGKVAVTMDAKGKELEKHAGKTVEAMGVVSEKDGVKTITIESVKPEMPKMPKK